MRRRMADAGGTEVGAPSTLRTIAAERYAELRCGLVAAVAV